jgi:6-phosphogluconate dehydrogenase
MELAMIGLGRMGANMTRRLARGGVRVRVYDVSAAARAALSDLDGVSTAHSLAETVAALMAPRVVWLMLPAGEPTESTLAQVASLLSPGDIVVDGANAYYKDSVRRGQSLAAHGLRFVDAGVSGGVWGLDNGYAIMLGGTKEAVERVAPFVRVLAPAPDAGWLHCGPVGAGHFVKMVHNGIEYGMMQAYAEGLSLMAAKTEFGLDLAAITQMWRHGSVVRSWLLDLTADALARNASLDGFHGEVADSGEGRWTINAAVDAGVPVPVLATALFARFSSRNHDDFANRLLSAMRQEFGGHVERTGSPKR